MPVIIHGNWKSVGIDLEFKLLRIYCPVKVLHSLYVEVGAIAVNLNK